MERLESRAIPAKERLSKFNSPSESLVPVIRSSILSRFPEVICGLSTRNGGISPEPYGMNTSFSVGDSDENVKGNRRLFLNALGVLPDCLAIPQQKHTAIVKTVRAEGNYEECDALITNVPHVMLSVSVADCTPVFLFDRTRGVVGCVHAGWRGTEQQILRKTVLRMQQDFGSAPETLYAFIGSSAGQCCYEVGEEVAAKFDVEFVLRRSGKLYLDIKRANKQQLGTVGVPGPNIEVLEDCTICNPTLYHSYRRDKEKSGRMMGIIGLNH